MSFSITNQKLISSERNVMILKQIHTKVSEREHFLLPQCKCWIHSKGDSNQTLERPCPSDHWQNETTVCPESPLQRENQENLVSQYQPESALLRHHQLFVSHHNLGHISLKHNCLKQFRVKTPSCSQVKPARSFFTSFARSFRLSFRTLSRNDHLGHR